MKNKQVHRNTGIGKRRRKSFLKGESWDKKTFSDKEELSFRYTDIAEKKKQVVTCKNWQKGESSKSKS